MPKFRRRMNAFADGTKHGSLLILRRPLEALFGNI